MPNETVARNSPPTGTLKTLQAGRGIAAMAVLFHHVANGVQNKNGPLPDWLATLCSYGYLGVDFFFVLSGFIIYYVNHYRVDRPGFVRSYSVSRITRVYVPYLPVGIAVGIAYVVLPQLASGENHWDWFSTLTLLPGPEHPALAPAWTLQHELLFYLFALIAFLSGRFMLLSVLAAGAVTAASFAFPGSYKALGLVDLEFLFGITAAYCFIHGKLHQPLLLIALGLLSCAAFFYLDNRMLSVLFGLGLAFMLLPLVRAEAIGRVKIGAALMLLGNASYAIYLIHYPLISALTRVTLRLNELAAFALILIVATAFGIAYHLLFEKPALKLVKGWLDGRKHSPLTTSATSGKSSPDPGS